MNKELKSAGWAVTMEAIRKCHLSLLEESGADTATWKEAFDMLMNSIRDERKLNPAFAREITELTEDSGSAYDFENIFEEYFDHLEENNAWDDVIASCDAVVAAFTWEKSIPSEYMFRKGNALEESGRLEEAEAFGKEWLTKYPTDLYAVASNVFLMIEMKKYDEAEALTEKYLRDDLICDNTTDTFFMAAYRLYEMTENINAKQRIEKKIAEYQQMTE